MSSEKNETSVWSMIKLGLILGAFAVAACTCLAVVNNITSPVIQKNKMEKASVAMKKVMPEAESFEEKDQVYVAKTADKVIGAVAEVTGSTYNEATILVGVSSEGFITGVEFLANSDSPGFGLKASDPSFILPSGKTFYGQFAGISSSSNFECSTDFDAISGATITSKGVGNLVRTGAEKCMAALKEIKGE